jgi:hypothetical protein
MPVVQFARFKSDDAVQVIKNVRISKKIFEKHGTEFLRLSRFHTGAFAGEFLITTRYSSWEAYGNVQEAVAKDPDFAKVLSQTMEIAELTGRNIAVSIDL